MVNEMKLNEELAYRVGLSNLHEMVISSHFMQKVSQNEALHLYDDDCFKSKQVVVDRAFVMEDLIPILKAASARLCDARAAAARRRAGLKHQDYGYNSEAEIGVSEIITEALLDKEFSRSGDKYNCRLQLNSAVKKMIAEKDEIAMVIPALPFKISSPLKSRGILPDLGEINFLLNLYEITRTIEVICQNQPGSDAQIRVKFTVVSDGSRFDEIVNEKGCTLKRYQQDLEVWITMLGVDDYVQLIDYQVLLEKNLPQRILDEKYELFKTAHADYSRVLWPVFDPDRMQASLEAATQVELDPEYDNAEGRFASLFKSLVYTVRYKALEDLCYFSDAERSRIYRELTAHIYEPFTFSTDNEQGLAWSDNADNPSRKLTPQVMERLRHAMLTETWAAAINYISEIKSDRDLAEDPILTCLPGHLRWTIHPKQGQLAIATPPILGFSIQPWAGSAVFRATSKGGVRLCTLPSLVLEAASAVPVVLKNEEEAVPRLQPLFYLDKELCVDDISSLLPVLKKRYTRQRFS